MQPRPLTDPRLAAVLARLESLIDWERRDRVRGQQRLMRVDVRPAADLLERLGRPDRRFRAVHVAGTKGKGSTCALIEAGLVAAGLRAGRYASPHVERVVERVSLGGRSIDEGALADSLERALAARDAALAAGSPGAGATWFDVLTAGAFDALAVAGIELAVVECGLGGRLDSTNVLAADIAVVTNVDLEHTELLGSTRAAIAREKGGILERGSVLVTGVAPGESGDEAGIELDRIAREQGARVVRPLLGGADTLADRNAALAGAVLDELGRSGLRAADGLPVGSRLLDAETRARARLPGRQELLSVPAESVLGPAGVGRGEVPLLLDGAHVPASLRAVLDEAQRPDRLPGLCIAVVALGSDKDALGYLKVLAGRVDRLACTSKGVGPSHAPEDLRGVARRLGIEAEVLPAPEAAIERAMQLALERSTRGGWVLVTGSLHLVGAVRSRLVPARQGSSC